jgi:DNA-binding GntR family transcriptional regulator
VRAGTEFRRPSAYTTRDRVYDLILDGIMRGDFADGSFIEEEMVCQMAGVSRTPVREAFNQLAAERILELLPRRGAMVRHVTARELTEVYEARRLIEGHAVRQICQHQLKTPAAMVELCERMEQIGADDLVQAGELNRQFHRELVAASGNRILIELFDRLHSRIIRVALSALQADPSRTRVICSEHRGLVAKLDAGDTEGALTLLYAHLQPQSNIIAQLPR